MPTDADTKSTNAIVEEKPPTEPPDPAAATRHWGRTGQGRKKGVILLVEDDQGDQLLTREALGESGLAVHVQVVSDGEEALEYLRRTGKYQDVHTAPRPDLVLLDLNMPKVNGRQVAAQLKEDPNLQTIPIVVLSTSDYREDVTQCYELGVNSYVHKPTDFDEFVDTIRAIEQYWLRVVEPPATP